MTRPPTTSAEPLWASSSFPLTAPRGKVLGALLTTYEPPDPRFLVEETLPQLLDLQHGPSEEHGELALFLTELHERLKELRGHLTVVSSAAQVDGSSHWLWSLVRRLHVGAETPVTQHAKLWLVHRSEVWDDDRGEVIPEVLEVVVSSTNLTRSAFHGQIQAGWHASLPLGPRPSLSRQHSWRLLVPFLNSLGRACGPRGSACMEGWCNLLGRAEAPKDVSFIASVPGVHDGRTLSRARSAWGAAGVARALGEGSHPLHVHVAVPTVGEWRTESVQDWARRLGTDPHHLRLAWIGRDHPWAARWSLSSRSLRAIRTAGATIASIPNPVLEESAEGTWLHKSHRWGDRRWSHAKVYWLARGRLRRALVTSANLSQSAWGRAEQGDALHMENFELGVLVPASELPVRDLDPLGEASTGVAEPQRPQGGSAWGEAVWDGRHVSVLVRPYSSEITPEPTVEVTTASAAMEHEGVVATWTLEDGFQKALWPWEAARGVPALVTVALTDQSSLSLPVFDDRPAEDLAETHCPEVDEDEALRLRTRLLEERYGYRTVDGDDIERERTHESVASGSTVMGGYGVPTFEEARRRLSTVDAWAERLERTSNAIARKWILRDGAHLARLWVEHAAGQPADDPATLPVRIAAEELTLRVKRAQDES